MGSSELNPAEFLDWLTDYYLTELAIHQERVFNEGNRAFMRRGLNLCWNLGQMYFFPGGFVGYVRADYAHIETLFSRDMDLIEALGVEELTGGNVLFFAEVLSLKRGEAFPACRYLSQLPGVEYLAAWRNLDRRKVQRVVKHEQRNGQAKRFDGRLSGTAGGG